MSQRIVEILKRNPSPTTPRRTRRLPAPRQLVSSGLMFTAALVAAQGVAQVAPQTASARWVNAEQVNVRSLPGLQGDVVSRLPLAAPVKLLAAVERSPYCEIEAESVRGFVACRFLSASLQAITAAAATGPAATANTRWVSGSGVNLRGEPSLQAAVVARLAINERVDLVVPAAGPYCEVVTVPAAGVGLRGYTACQYLSTSRVDRSGLALLPDGSPNPHVDLAKNFWAAPSWAALEAYGQHLRQTRIGDKTDAQDTPTARPADPEFDRMKAHLALGIYGAAAAPMPEWDALRRMADGASTTASGLRGLLMLWGPEFEPGDAGPSRTAGVVQALTLPPVAPSLFQTQSDIALGSQSAAALSGRFHIPHTYRTKGRYLGPDRGWVDGLWDIGQYTVALTQPLTSTTLFRDGRVRSAPSRGATTATAWGNSDGPMCEGYRDGFTLGEAEPRLRREHGLDATGDGNPPPVARGSLVSFYTRAGLPILGAALATTRQTLDRGKTGFAAATLLTYDLNGDGVADIAAWEGVGHGPGHMEGPTTTDDAWYRLFFANIAGQWHVLGSDQFGYGCGC